MQCVISNSNGLQTTTIDRVRKILDKMKYHTCTAVIDGETRTIDYYTQPDSNYLNRNANMVTQNVIYGPCIFFGITAEEITKISQSRTTWSNLARSLPKKIPLDSLARERLRAEQAERNACWIEYFQRKTKNDCNCEEECECEIE